MRILLLCSAFKGKLRAGKSMFLYLALAKDKTGQPGSRAARTEVISFS